jgi:flavorubredoxin
MDTRVAEVADGIYQLSTYVDPPSLGFNQYLVTGDEPLLFHTGMRGLFPSVSKAVASIIPLDSLRWISFGHVEADESGAMNDFLNAAPNATVTQGFTGCAVSIGDLADREPRHLADGEVLDIGGHRLRWLDTPHMPHAWEAGALYDETTKTLFCGDVFTAFPAPNFDAVTDDVDNVVGPALASDEAGAYGSWSRSPDSPAQLRRMAELDVATLAPMHASSYTGPDCAAALLRVADSIEKYVG